MARQSALPQPELPLDHEAAMEPTLRHAHARSGLEMPYEQALRHPLFSRCLKNIATAMRRKAP